MNAYGCLSFTRSFNRVNCLQLSLQQTFQKVARGYDNCKIPMISAMYSYFKRASWSHRLVDCAGTFIATN